MGTDFISEKEKKKQSLYNPPWILTPTPKRKGKREGTKESVQNQMSFVAFKFPEVI